MPTYQYACTACGERLEVVQKFTDDPLTDCPACTGRLRKVFSAVGVVFKGSGFYRTDSRAGATTGDGAKADGGAAAPGAKDKPATDQPAKGAAKNGSGASTPKPVTPSGTSTAA